MPATDPDRDGGAPPRHDAAADLELVRRIASRDTAALAELYDRFAPLVLALARRVLDDPGDAEDVAQEVFAQVWQQAARYDGARSSVSTWLTLITRSRSIDRLRSRQVRERTATAAALEHRGDRHTSPEGTSRVWYDERARRVRSALEALPPEQREVLELAFYREMTQREIAAATGAPLGTVKTRTLLAMKKLRQALQEELSELL